MPSKDTDVLIVGAGLAGLVAAISLRKSELRVRVIDKEQFWRRGSKGAVIQARTVELYRFIAPEILDELFANGTTETLSRAYKPGTLDVMNEWHFYPPVNPSATTPLPNSLWISQEVHESILRRYLLKLGVEVECSKELTSITQHSDSVVAAITHRVNNDSRDKVGLATETIEAAYVVGADGSRSVTRKLIQLDFSARSTNETERFLIGEFRMSKALPTDTWHFWGDKATTIVWLRPNPSAEAASVFTLIFATRGVDYTEMLSNHTSLLEFLNKSISVPDIQFEEVIMAWDYRPQVRMVDHFSNGRVFLAGDSAHIHPATGGQGLNAAVQDASNLSWKLALSIASHSDQRQVTSLLSSYSTERVPVIEEMLFMTHSMMQKTFDAKISMEAAFTRDTIKTRMLGINYRHSPIVLDERFGHHDGTKTTPYECLDGRICAGDRAPDAPDLEYIQGGQGVTSLFSLFSGNRHTILIFPSVDHDYGRSIEPYLLPFSNYIARTVLILSRFGHYEPQRDLVAVQDTSGHAVDAYQVGDEPRGLTVVLRPDGYIGAVAYGGKGVSDYFSLLLE